MAQTAKNGSSWCYFSNLPFKALHKLQFEWENHNLCCVVGPENGLELVINVEQYENIPDMANNIGVAVSSKLTVVD